MVSEHTRHWLVAAAPPVLAMALVVAVGWPGLQPGVAYWDTGEFQTIAPTLGTGHSPGFPTYVIVGWLMNVLLAPLGEPAFRMNVFSLLSLGLAAACLAIIVLRLGGAPILALAAAIGMAMTGVVWYQATRAEPHMLHLAFVGLLFVLLVEWGRRRRLELGQAPDGLEAPDHSGPLPERRSDRWLVGGAFVFGLGAGNHGLMTLLALPVLLYVLAVDARTVLRPKLVLACVLAAAGTLVLVYLELPIRAGLLRAPLVYGNPNTWDGFWYVALATQFHSLISHPFADLPGKLGEAVDLTAREFGIIAVLIPVGFLATVRLAPRYALLSGSAMVITMFFNSFFNDGYIDRYYVGPVFWAWTWLAMLGAFAAARAAELLEALRPELLADNGRARFAAATLAAVVAIGLLVPNLLAMPRNAARADRHADTSAQHWLDSVYAVLPPHAVLVSWWSVSTPLWYGQIVEGQRPDVFIADDRTMLDLNLGRAPNVIESCLQAGRPIYAIRANEGDLSELQRRFDMTLVVSGGSMGVYEVHGLLSGATAPSVVHACPGAA
jgi:hypothetical protein